MLQNGAESYFTLIDLAGSNSDFEHVAEQFDSAYNTWGASSYFAGSYDDAGVSNIATRLTT